MSTLPPITNLQAFEAVARRRSFALAAAELHLTASAISHQVARLESQLGVRLFERSAHGVKLSTAGETYLERVGGALSAIMTATEDLRQGTSTRLRVHAAPSIASLWLMPRLKRFAKAYPDITLNLSAAHTPSDFSLGQADIDIRYGVPQWPELVVEPMFQESILPLASPEFIEEHALKDPQQLLSVPLIQSNVSVVQWHDWLSRFTNLRSPEHFVMRFDRAQMSLDAAAQGLGVALESVTIAGAHIHDKKMCPIFDIQMAVQVKAHFAVYPSRHAKRPPVEAFLAWLHREAAYG